MKAFSFVRRNPWLVAALGLVAAALALRATADHGFVTLYTGDNGEELTLNAARNFEKFGFAALKFLPVHRNIDGAVLQEPPPYYTHSPPLPSLIVGIAYVLSGGSVFAARLLVILVTLLGLYFATRAAEAMAPAFAPRDEAVRTRVSAVLPLLLATSVGVLCYGDALTEVPMEETVQWMILWSLARFLTSSGSEGLLSVASLAALQMWTGLDWILPTIAAVGYCVVVKPLGPRERKRALLIAFGAGVAVPLALRLVQNAWALGGLAPAVQDLYHRALIRSGGDPEYPYSLTRHIARFIVATAWLTGPVAPFLVWFDLRGRVHRPPEVRTPLRTLFMLWGIGSLSFQFVMPQAAMFHAYTCLHPANFLLLWAALAAARLWSGRPRLVAGLLALQLMWGGMVLTTEIGIPFLRDSSARMVARLCRSDRADLEAAIPEMSSSISKMIGSRLKATPAAPECGAGSATAKGVLWIYLRVIRVSSLE